MFSDSHAQPADVATCAPETADAIRFLAHDLQSPIEAIRQIAFYLSMSLPAADTRSRRRLLAMQRQIRNASWILEDAVLSTGASTPQFTIVDLREVVANALFDWAVADTAWLCLDLGDEPSLVAGDAAQIEQLIRRLALLLSADARQATVIRCRGSAETVVLEFVAPGSVEIPRALLEPGECAPAATLATGRRMLDAHGARVEVERGEGKVTLRIVFPAASVDRQRED